MVLNALLPTSIAFGNESGQRARYQVPGGTVAARGVFAAELIKAFGDVGDFAAVYRYPVSSMYPRPI